MNQGEERENILEPNNDDKLFTHHIQKMKSKLVPTQYPPSTSEMIHRYVVTSNESMLGIPEQRPI